jgi:hypothetical protein
MYGNVNLIHANLKRGLKEKDGKTKEIEEQQGKWEENLIYVVHRSQGKKVSHERGNCVKYCQLR